VLDGVDVADRARLGTELSARLVATLATASADAPARVLEVDDGTRRALREGQAARH